MRMSMNARAAVFLLCVLGCAPGSRSADTNVVDSVAQRFLAQGLGDCSAYEMLRRLTQSAPHRLSGSRGAAAALDISGRMMEGVGAVNVRAASLMVRHC